MNYDFQAVDSYLQSIEYTAIYQSKEENERQKLVFTAYDRLSTYFDEKYLTPKIIGLQTIYMMEGEEEEFAKFKRHGVSSMGLKGMSFSFDITQHVSPDVLAIIQRAMSTEKRSGARVGRLV
ncbi:hypothetical protein [Bacillus weihaiensis]|uniref:hypothetical protein n=1 Tax=Bacillus weihaiensis TaxID=1547283 RepID=UPI0023537419|nr:hypothetical protein [Bacillus weihaiensis]